MDPHGRSRATGPQQHERKVQWAERSSLEHSNADRRRNVLRCGQCGAATCGTCTSELDAMHGLEGQLTLPKSKVETARFGARVRVKDTPPGGTIDRQVVWAAEEEEACIDSWRAWATAA